jgi:hypothetical protein
MPSQTELEQRLAIVVGGSEAFAFGITSASAEVALSQLQQQISAL